MAYEIGDGNYQQRHETLVDMIEDAAQWYDYVIHEGRLDRDDMPRLDCDNITSVAQLQAAIDA
ncbi:hypothetical protein LCGC14_0638090, partial [marine sediment metagenome]